MTLAFELPIFELASGCGATDTRGPADEHVRGGGPLRGTNGERFSQIARSIEAWPWRNNTMFRQGD
jgi:hypothetical protein